MTIPFVGGLYDGLRLGVVEIEKHLVILTLRARGRVRRFTYLPVVDDWPAVLAGRMRVDDSQVYHYYELLSTPHGPLFRSDKVMRGYRRAVDEASTGRLEEDPRPEDGAD